MAILQVVEAMSCAAVRNLVLVLTGFLLVVGCSGRTDSRVLSGLMRPPDSVIALTERLEFEEPGREIELLDLGAPWARSHLLAGWSYDEGVQGGSTGVWSVGNSSDVEFFAFRPQDLSLDLKCWAPAVQVSESQLVTVEVNGTIIGDLRVGPNRGSAFRLTVPGSVLRHGSNRLTFRYAWTVRPVELTEDSGDYRSLGIMCDEIAFKGLVTADEPGVLRHGQARGLRVPARSSVGFHVIAPEDAALQIGGIIGRHLHGCTLDVDIVTESGETDHHELTAGRRISKPRNVALAAERGERLEVRFTVRASTAHEICRGAVEIWEPHITGSIKTLRTAPGTGQPAREARLERKTNPNVLIYLIDCLRADHLGVYGYKRAVSPSIDRLAADGVTFDNAIAASSWTRPAVASLLTGLPAGVHGTQGDREALASDLPVLQEILQSAGYETMAVITNGVISSSFGFDRGFDVFRFLPEQHKRSPEIHQLSDRVNDEFFEWLSSRDGSKPFFAYLHSTDPHAPYLPRSPFKERFAGSADSAHGLHAEVEDLTQGKKTSTPEIRQALIDLYDAEIAFNDEQFGLLIERLKTTGIYDDTIIVLTADHGEEFGDHGRWQHGFTLYHEQLHVPLIFKLPSSAAAGERRTDRVSQIDITPTLLDSLRVEVPSSMLGVPLRPWLAEGRSGGLDRPIFADLRRDPQWRYLQAVVLGKDKLIWNQTYDLARPRWELYDIESDPGETMNRSAERPVNTGYLATLLREAGAIEASVAPTAELSEADEEKLRALGYLQ